MSKELTESYFHNNKFHTSKERTKAYFRNNKFCTSKERNETYFRNIKNVIKYIFEITLMEKMLDFHFVEPVLLVEITFMTNMEKRIKFYHVQNCLLLFIFYHLLIITLLTQSLWIYHVLSNPPIKKRKIPLYKLIDNFSSVFPLFT